MSPVEAVDADRLLRTSLELDAIDSPTGHEQEIGAHHETTFADLGCATTRDDVGNLVAVFPGTGDRTILVATRMDAAGTDHGVVLDTAAAIRSVGLEVVPRTSGGGTDGNLLDARGIPCVALPAGMVDEHATGEHIAVADLVTACRVLVAIVTQHGDRTTDREGAPA